MENCEYKKRPDSIADILEKIKAEQYAEWSERAIGQFVSDHSGGANKMVDVRGKDNNVSTNIDLEAWEPCESCISCDNCRNQKDYDPYEGTYGECGQCYGYAHFEPCNFCHECGKPLTPEARSMLEKRLRGFVE